MHYRISEWTYEGRNLRNLLSGSLCCMEFNFWRADWKSCPRADDSVLLFCHLCPLCCLSHFLLPFYFFFTHASGMAVWMTMSTTLAQTEISNLLDWLPWRYVQSFLVPKLCILMILPTFSYSKPPYTWSLIMGMTFTASRHLTKSVTLHGNRMLQLVRSINHSWRVNWVNTTNTFIGD